MSAQLCVWDLTCPAEEVKEEHLDAFLNTHAKKWVYQLEKGAETGYLHYQVRFDLKQRARKSQVLRLMALAEVKGHLSPTSGTACTGPGRFSYVMKEDTRVAGPWQNPKPKVPVPARFDIEEKLHPWQDYVLNSIEYDTREIHFIVDPSGGAGKSTFANYCRYDQEAVMIPDFRDVVTTNQILFGKLQDRDPDEMVMIIIDMPRNLPKEEVLKHLASHLESIKNGYCYDTRYSFREASIGVSKVVVFSNEPLTAVHAHLSADRTVEYRICPETMHLYKKTSNGYERVTE